MSAHMAPDPPALVPFEPGHLRRLIPGRHEIEVLGGIHPGQLAHIPIGGPAVTLMQDDLVLGCAGITPEGGTGIVWSILSDQLRQRPLMLHRAAKGFLIGLTPRFGVLRSYVRTDFEPGHHWLRALGFGRIRDRRNFLNTGRTFSEYEMAGATPYLAIASAIAAGAQTTAAARAQAKQASYQAAIARQQAQHEARILQAQEQQLRRNQSKGLAAQRAVLAARGLDLTAGSALLTQEQAAADAEFDALLRRSMGSAQLFDSRARAGMEGMQASAARANAAFETGTSLLTAGKVTSKNWKKIEEDLQ